MTPSCAGRGRGPLDAVLLEASARLPEGVGTTSSSGTMPVTEGAVPADAACFTLPLSSGGTAGRDVGAEAEAAKVLLLLLCFTLNICGIAELLFR